MNNSVKKCIICNNEKCGEFITINDKKYHLCCIEELQQENTQLKSVLKEIREFVLAGRYGEEGDYESISLYMPDLLEIIDKGLKVGEQNG